MYHVMAVGAHPDDIEFHMLGTILLLLEKGCSLTYMNIANGDCGSTEYSKEETARIRLTEAKSVAETLSAQFIEPLTSDIQIFYTDDLIRKLTAIIRQQAPDLLLIHSPNDYMEDHSNACRLMVTAAFCRSMPNYNTEPAVPPIFSPITIYHAQPHLNRDYLGQRILPDCYVNISEHMERKKALLSYHSSQKEWLDKTQGMDSYLQTMVGMGMELGTHTPSFLYAEGWRRHHPAGFCNTNDHPLKDILGEMLIP